MSEQQLLRDADIEPTSEVIAKSLGNINDTYIKFMEGLKSHDIDVCWRYYNDGKAWLGKALYKWTTIRGTKKEITIFWLSVWDGFFKVSIYIPEKVRAEALKLSLSAEVKGIIENAEQMGKLKYFPVVFEICSDKLFDDIYTFIEFRKTIK